MGVSIGAIIGGIVGSVVYFTEENKATETESTRSSLSNLSEGASVPEGKTKILLLLLSFFVNVAGLVIGIIYINRPDAASRQFAKQIFVATGAGFIIIFLYTLI